MKKKLCITLLFLSITLFISGFSPFVLYSAAPGEVIEAEIEEYSSREDNNYDIIVVMIKYASQETHRAYKQITQNNEAIYYENDLNNQDPDSFAPTIPLSENNFWKYYNDAVNFLSQTPKNVWGM